MCQQIVDTGVDETSCFFADGDGQTVPHGHFFEELGIKTLAPTPSPASEAPPTSETISSISLPSSSPPKAISGSYALIFEGGDLSTYPGRRKVSAPESVFGQLRLLPFVGGICDMYLGLQQ